MKLYINGLLQSDIDTYTLVQNTSGPKIGSFYTHGSLPFNGSIDEVMVFDRALSPEEINASYNAGIWRLNKNFTNLEPGTYTYKAYVVDQAGNLNETEERTFIVNSAPTVTSAVLTSTSGNDLTWDNLTVSATYSDNDSNSVSLIYDFRKDDVSDAVLNMPFDVNGSNGNTSNVKDYSTFGNNGTLIDATWNASCNAFSGSGGCYELDGINDYIGINKKLFTDNQYELSVESWIYINEINNATSSSISTPIFSSWNTWNPGGQTGQLLRVYHAQNTNLVSLSHTIANGTEYGGVSTPAISKDEFEAQYANQWIHLVTTFKANEFMRIYINGQINASKTSSLPEFMYPSPDTDWIGRTGINSGYLNGSIDQVKIYNRTLSSEEVAMLYNNGAGMYNRTHSNATNYSDSWKVVVTPTDQYEEGEPYTSNTLTINSPPSKVTLAEPINGNITMTNRSVHFRWLPATDVDSDSITYNLSIKCYSSLGGSCSPSDDRDYIGITGTSYNLTEATELRYLRDDTYYYNWTVTAYDGYQYGEISNQSNFSLISEVIITMSVDGVDFGNMGNDELKNTTTRIPAPLEIHNLGNVLTDINISSATELFETGPFPGSSFQYRVNTTPDYTAAFNAAGTQTSWTNIPIVNQTIIDSLNYSTGSDKADIDLHVQVPTNEPSGDKSSILTFIGWYA